MTMSKEEIKALKEVHYRNIKDMCFNYYDNEICTKHTFITDLSNALIPFEDRRLKEINKLIDNFIKERDRIIEIGKMQELEGNNE